MLAKMTNLSTLVHEHTKLAKLRERPTEMVNMIDSFSLDTLDDFVNSVPDTRKEVDKDEQIQLN